MARGTTITNYALFALLSLFLGTSYAWTKLGLDGLDPLSFVFLRLLIGVCVLALWMRARHEHLPRDREVVTRLAALGSVNVIGAFVLITWGQQYVPSSYAAILVAAGPIFSALGAALLLPDEGLGGRRVAGVAVGFVGVVALFVGDLGAETDGASHLRAATGAAAIVAGAAIVASVAIAVRLRVRGLSPVQIVLPQVLAGTVTVAVLTAVAGAVDPGSFRVGPITPGVVAALLALGLLNAGLGNLVYYRLILSWGVSRTALVGYVAPFVGAIVGAGFLDEQIGWTLVAGLSLITISLVVMNAGSVDLPVRGTSAVAGIGSAPAHIERRAE